MRASVHKLIPLPFILGALLAGCGSGDPWAGITAEELARLDEHRIRGIALLEGGKAPEAGNEFLAIQKARPNLAFGYLARAATYVARPGEGGNPVADAQKAASLLPGRAWPLVVEGVLLERAGRGDEATPLLEKALKLEPNHPRVLAAAVAHYQNLPGDHAVRLQELRERLAQVAPRNLSAQIGLLQSRLENGSGAQVLETLAALEALMPRLSPDQRDFLERTRAAARRGDDASQSGRSLANLLRGSAQFQANQGALFGSDKDPARLLEREWVPAPPPLPPPPLPATSIAWRDVTEERGLAGVRARGVAPIGVGDIDLAEQSRLTREGGLQPHQGREDLAVGRMDGGPRLAAVTGFNSHPSAERAGSPLLLDLDNDFTLEAYVAAPDGDFVWRNPVRGERARGPEQPMFSRSKATPPVRVPARGDGSATAADIDQDGDLDVLRASSAPGEPPVRYLRNNGNFTFTDLTAQVGLSLSAGGARQVVAADFDSDQDLDLFVVREGADSRLFVNRRQDVLQDRTADWGLEKGTGALAAAAADYDRDGDWDLAVAGRAPRGSMIYRNAGSRFEAEPAALPLPSGFQARWVEWVDYDNDSWLDLAVAGSGGLYLLHNQGGTLTLAEPALEEPARWVGSIDYDRDGDADLIAVTEDDRVRLLSNEGGSARPSVRIEAHGYYLNVPPADPTQPVSANNSYGLGAGVLVRTLWDEQPVLVNRPSVLLGLGRASRAVTMRVDWLNGAPEGYIAPPRSAALALDQHPGNSCPFLYAWDGERYVFLKDFNWRSPLGMLQARGKSVPHDLTQDWVKIPGDLLRPEGGYYRLIATEELREIAYFDQLQLLAVDHPQGTGVYLDERFPFGPPDPFRIYTTRQERRPVSARNEAGQDLLPLLEQVDNRYTPVPPGPLRGICAPHDLVLDLGSVPDPQQVKLFLTGWIYPQPNSSNINASQNPEIRLVPPTLSFGDGKGGWTRSDGSVGLPCGKRKTIVLDLSGRFTPGDYQVKLTTTCEIRWDAAFFTSGEAPVEVRQHDIPLLEADLREEGLCERYYEVPDGPDEHRYERRLQGLGAPEWPPIEGAYTRLGDCTALLAGVDDQYLIMGGGDAVHLLFDGRNLPPLPAGWARDYVVRTDGWTKDADSNTVSGETVGPLPFHGLRRYPYGPEERFPGTPTHRRWMREWNTRVKRRADRPSSPPSSW